MIPFLIGFFLGLGIGAIVMAAICDLAVRRAIEVIQTSSNLADIPVDGQSEFERGIRVATVNCIDIVTEAVGIDLEDERGIGW